MKRLFLLRHDPNASLPYCFQIWQSDDPERMYQLDDDRAWHLNEQHRFKLKNTADKYIQSHGYGIVTDRIEERTYKYWYSFLNNHIYLPTVFDTKPIM